jgi:TPR repeat protein
MACEAGSSSAFFDLGKIYAEGNEVTKNIIKAKELFTIAKELEYPDAEAELKKL